MELQSGTDRLTQAHAQRQNAAIQQRAALLFDDNSFTEIGAFAQSGQHEAEVMTGYGTVGGTPVYAFLQNPELSGGAMGQAQASKIKKIYRMAAETGLPVVGVFDSIGAYINEGLGTVKAYGELMREAARISGVVPQISVVLGSCSGSAAIMAANADVLVVSKKGQLFLTPPSLLNGHSTDAGSARSAFSNGTAALYAQDEAGAFDYVRRLLSLLPVNNLAPVPAMPAAAPAGDTLPNSLIDADSGLELSAEFGPGVSTMLARINGVACGLVLAGQPFDTEACAKASRFVRLCDCFTLPLITLVDTAGFEPSEHAELSNAVRNAALLSHAYAEATTPKIAVLTGTACGAALTILAGHSAQADLVFALPDAEISVLPTKTAVSILWNDRIKAGESRQDLVREYAATEASPLQAAAQGFVDDVCPPQELRLRISTALAMLAGKRASSLPKKHSNMPL